jgi:hypothetical protein
MHRTTRRGNMYDVPEYILSNVIQKKSRSWDNMPASIIKPFAGTALNHHVELVALLGMHQRTFNIARGTLHAQGNSYVFTASQIPGFGILATFSIIGLSKFWGNRVIPPHDITQWVFGVVPSRLSRSLELSTLADIRRTMVLFKNGTTISNLYEQKSSQTSVSLGW